MQQGPFWGHLSLVPLVASGVLAILLLLSAMMLRKRTLRLRLPARFESIRWLSSVVDELAREARMSEEAIFQCRLAIDEALANIINHSYRRDPSGEIEAFIQADSAGFRIHLTDYGEPYDPTSVNVPAMTRSIDEVKPGGLGLHLMRSVMDKVEYTPGPRGNRLVMVKHCRNGQAATS